jgi:hypothetical protein
MITLKAPCETREKLDALAASRTKFSTPAMEERKRRKHEQLAAELAVQRGGR